MSRTFSAVALWMLVAAMTFGQSPPVMSEPIMIGDVAPGLTGAKWLRGNPIVKWQEGHLYLLDFWATWCAPCLQMMPTHQALQDRYENNRFHVIGVAIWSQEGPMSPDQALEKHSGLTYAVAQDVGDRLAGQFMGGTGTQGLPTFMLVDQQGRLAWVGEPGEEFDTVLEELIDGTFDLAAARKGDIVRRESQAIFSQIDDLRREGRPWEAAESVDKVIAIDPRENGWAYAMKYEILVGECNAPGEAKKEAENFLAKEPGLNPFFNYVFALRITRADGTGGPHQRELDLGLHLAKRAVDLSKEPNADYLASVARIYSLRGEMDDAVRWQQRAITVAPPAQVHSLTETLNEYQRIEDGPR